MKCYYYFRHEDLAAIENEACLFIGSLTVFRAGIFAVYVSPCVLPPVANITGGGEDINPCLTIFWGSLGDTLN